MIVVPITKKMEIVMSIQVCLISRMNFGYTKNGGKKAFPINPKHQHRVSHCGEHDCNANIKRMEIVMGIQVCLILEINFNCKENGEKKSFSCQIKASISCILMR